MPSTPFDSDPDSYGAKLRAKGVQVSPAGMARHNGKTPSSNAQYNGWERGIAHESRPGGTQMPYLNGDGAAIPIKTFTEKRSKFEEIRKRQLTAS
jgi:hypothetical protein